MSVDFKKWCDQNTDVRPLVRALNSSMPEQYIGFYLEKSFPNKTSCVYGFEVTKEILATLI